MDCYASCPQSSQPGPDVGLVPPQPPNPRAPCCTAAQEAAFRQREDALKQRDLELQESLLRFTRFLQENDAKRAKANRRAGDEARQRAEREAEIARLQREAAASADQRRGVAAALARVVRYQQYLQGVVEAGEAGFQEVGDVLARHATLTA